MAALKIAVETNLPENYSKTRIFGSTSENPEDKHCQHKWMEDSINLEH